MRHEAIRNLYPQVNIIDDKAGCFDYNNEFVEIDEETVAAEIERLLAEHRSKNYQRQRSREYPPLQDFADAMYWHRKGNDSLLDAYVAACDLVKARYPKGE
jgi:hypothetical protein